MRERTLAITFTSLLAISFRAHAEGLVADRFSPAVTGGGYITVERPDTLGDLRFQVGLLSTYAASPLRVVAGPFSSPVIDGSLATTVAASLGVRSFLELGFSVPVVLYQTGSGATTVAALGDI